LGLCGPNLLNYGCERSCRGRENFDLATTTRTMTPHLPQEGNATNNRCTKY